MTLIVRFASRSLIYPDVDRSKPNISLAFEFRQFWHETRITDYADVRFNGFFPGQKEGAER